jgi:methanogenic corrinoid protein MtbC1
MHHSRLSDSVVERREGGPGAVDPVVSRAAAADHALESDRVRTPHRAGARLGGEGELGDAAGALDALRERFLRAQLAGDRAEAVRVAQVALAAGTSARDVHLEIVAKAQREIGHLWQENRITVADEHQATAISQVVLSVVYPHLERQPRVGKSILLACVEGELHDMAVRIASDLLEAAGLDVCLLGASVPTDSLLAKIAARKPDVLLLSVTMTFHAVAARDAIARVRAAHPSLPIVVGGEAVVSGPDAWGSEVTTSRGDALDLATTVKRLLKVEAVGR